MFFEIDAPPQQLVKCIYFFLGHPVFYTICCSSLINNLKVLNVLISILIKDVDVRDKAGKEEGNNITNVGIAHGNGLSAMYTLSG